MKKWIAFLLIGLSVIATGLMIYFLVRDYNLVGQSNTPMSQFVNHNLQPSVITFGVWIAFIILPAGIYYKDLKTRGKNNNWDN